MRFAELIAELLDDPQRRERMGAVGRRRVEKALSWEVSRGGLLAAYEDLLARPQRRREIRQRQRRRWPSVSSPFSVRNSMKRARVPSRRGKPCPDVEVKRLQSSFPRS